MLSYAICYHLHNSKNTHWGVSFLVKLQAETSNKFINLNENTILFPSSQYITGTIKALSAVSPVVTSRSESILKYLMSFVLKFKEWQWQRVHIMGFPLLFSNLNGNTRPFPGSVHWRCSLKKGVLENFAKFRRKHLCRAVSFNSFINKETLVQVF